MANDKLLIESAADASGKKLVKPPRVGLFDRISKLKEGIEARGARSQVRRIENIRRQRILAEEKAKISKIEIRERNQLKAAKRRGKVARGGRISSKIAKSIKGGSIKAIKDQRGRPANTLSGRSRFQAPSNRQEQGRPPADFAGSPLLNMASPRQERRDSPQARRRSLSPLLD